MIDYKKIAIISVRIAAITFLLSGILQLGDIAILVLLVSRGAVASEVVLSEVWIVQAILTIAGGIFLHVRSKSMGSAIVETLFGEDAPAASDKRDPIP
jgi:hypothetical protein